MKKIPTPLNIIVIILGLFFILASDPTELITTEGLEEKDGTLSITSEVKQSDVDAGKYRVGTSFGVSFDKENITSGSIESTIKIVSHADSEIVRVRNKLTVKNKEGEIYHIGFGISYRDSSGSYHFNYYFEVVDANGVYVGDIPVTKLPINLTTTIEKGVSYKVKLVYDSEKGVVNGYFDDEKSLYWTIPKNTISFLKAATVEARTSAYRDSNTGLATASGAKITATIDDLTIMAGGSVIAEDDFNDGVLSNPDINISKRIAK